MLNDCSCVFIVYKNVDMLLAIGGARSTMDMEAAQNIPINGLSAVRVMVGRSGVTSGMKILI